MSKDTEPRKVALAEYPPDSGKLVIVLNPDSKYPFSFGLNKAKMIVDEECLDAIRKFVETGGKAIT